MRFKSMLGLLALAPALSYAQSSVTLYGMLDTGIQYLNHANSAGNSQVGMINAGFWPSRFGLRGQEDIGGGTTVLFQLENGFDSTSGALVSSGTLFNRTALVGLGNNGLGTLTAGRQYSVQYDKTLNYDPTSLASYSILSIDPIPLTTLRLNNSVKYLSPTLAGLNVEAMYGFGQQLAGNTEAGRYIGASLEYVVGPFATRFVYEESRGTVGTGIDQSGLADRRYSLAARWSVPNSYIVSAGVTRVGGDLQLTPRGTVYWATGGVWLSPDINLDLTAGRYDYQGKGQHSQMLTTSGRYFLSKTTYLYANVGYMANQGNADLSIYNYATTEAGKNQLGMSFGINKRF
ncbi:MULTISPECIES: porin [unclassified Caballeronia]|jgi:predicted porin|uniref:porin n=1 Tax=unclassified Caballeronia TaxID=2646786 RepID=UPI003ED16255